MSKKIGILGSGKVAQVLGNGFIKHGYLVMLGTRDASHLQEWKSKASGDPKVGTSEEATKFGDIIVLAVKGTSVEGLVRSVATHLQGKTVIDATNPISLLPPVNGVLKYFTDLNESLMEKLQKTAPAANFVKAFNSVGSQLMVNPDLPGGKPTMFIAGNSEGAKKQVTEILDRFGWETADMGKAEGARAIEPLCILWCIPGLTNNQWTHAFKLLKG